MLVDREGTVHATTQCVTNFQKKWGERQNRADGMWSRGVAVAFEMSEGNSNAVHAPVSVITK